LLHGKLIYIDEHVGTAEFDVYARDSFDNLKLYLMNQDLSKYENYMTATMVYDKEVVSLVSEDGKKITDEHQAIIESALASTSEKHYINDGKAIVFNAYENANPADERRLDIKKTNKYKSNISNREFCSRVSALVRYVQISGHKNYNQNVDEEEHFKTERIVHIDDIGFVKYEMGLIKELNIRGVYASLCLTTIPDDTFDVGIFKELKEKDKYGNRLSNTPIENVGFKLNSELLGFPYEPAYKKESVNLLGMYETIEDVIDANPEKNTSWVLDRQYDIVTDANLEQVMAEFYNFDGWIAFDTETTGLKINFKSRTGQADQLVGVVLSKEKGSGYYFPLQHKLFKNLCDGDHWYFMEKYMKRLLETKKIICHHVKFDWKVAYIYDINVNCLYDTMLAFGVTKRYEESSFELGLKALVRNIFGLDMFDLSDFVTSGSFGDSGITFADLPYELVRRYAPADTDMTLALFEFIEKEALLDKYEAHTVFKMEVNFAKAVAYSEFFGYHIDTVKIPDMKESILAGMEKYREEMFKMAGREFNPNSPPQLMKIMYDEMGIEQIGAKRSTGKEILKTLSDRTDENDEPLYPFVVALKNYRDNEGIHKNFLKKLHLFSTEDGYIFPEVLPLGTDTGRSSVKNPNYQSYNDPVKKNTTPRPGFYHFDSDFSQIEYRVLASMAKQESMMHEFDDPDLDYHTYQASRMFSIPYSLVSKALRGQSKGINFGLPYGMGDSSLGTRIFGVRNEVTKRKAGALRRKFFQGQEKIEAFFEDVRGQGVSNGYTSTHFGRRRYYHRGVFTVSEIRRQAGNHVIQGTAADIYKEACNRLFNRVVDEGWLGKVLFNVFVHDELLNEVHQSINPYYFFKAWREEFQLVIDGFCKLYAGAGVGMSWYTAKKQDLPPQYIDEVINTWNEDMDWDEDIPKFLESIATGYEEYKVRRVKEYITDDTHKGEIIKPVIYSLLVESVVNIIGEVQKDNVKLAEYNALFDSDLIYVKEDHKIKTLREYLAVFCRYFNLDSESVVDVRSPDEADKSSSSSDDEVEDVAVEFTDDAYSLEDIISLRGYYRDDAKNIIYFMDKPMTYNSIPTTVVNYLYQRGLFRLEGMYQLALYDDKDKSTVLYNAFMSESDYQILVSTYNGLNATRLNFAAIGW
jgi:DNA polymerase I-like protein with 3'-5' exonuclease and polymerase domains